eukprot:TRINITY_DN62864_c0_g1_i1.p1 TRINITY_DN62864_c0_g1~~TRINITY_DN62864_c0_g1_i1.p1  ORF type:complete len:266 (+),score=-31.82 TRINITY_DN62864_c0_g1_i1:108-905(+)
MARTLLIATLLISLLSQFARAQPQPTPKAPQQPQQPYQTYSVWDSHYTGTLSLIQGQEGGSCGYGATPGLPTIAISTRLYGGGAACGSCYALQCVRSQMCNAKQIIAVTVTSECVGQVHAGICRPNKKGVVMSPIAYDALVKNRTAGNIRVRLARVPCRRNGGLVFKAVMGTDYFIGVLVANAAGPGGIAAVNLKVGAGPWQPMTRNFGGVWSVSGTKVVGQPLSFQVASIAPAKSVVTAWNALPANWRVNGTYQHRLNFPLTPA